MASPARIQPKAVLHLTAENCPTDTASVADLYWMNGLSCEDMAAFEEHMLACPVCASVTAQTGQFLESFRAAEVRR